MKLIGSWDIKYVGFNHNGMDYYVAYTDPAVRIWGMEELYYDGPLYRFGLWFVSFHWHMEIKE